MIMATQMIVQKNFETLIVRFIEPINEIDGMFSDMEVWGVSSLEEWCNSYESTRFVQTDEHIAVITSEYNMECVTEWLRQHVPIAEMKRS